MIPTAPAPGKDVPAPGKDAPAGMATLATAGKLARPRAGSTCRRRPHGGNLPDPAAASKPPPPPPDASADTGATLPATLLDPLTAPALDVAL